MVSDAQLAQLSSKNHWTSPTETQAIGWPSDAERSPVLLSSGHLCRIISGYHPSGMDLGIVNTTFDHSHERSGATERFANHPRRTSDWVFHIIPRAIHAIYEATEKHLCHRLFRWRSLCAGLPITAQSRAEDNLTHHGGNTGNHRERV